MSTQVNTEALAAHTTSRVGGPAQAWVVADTEKQIVEAIREADQADTPVLVLGGGSNILAADAGFPGTVVRLATTGISTEELTADSGQPRVRVTVAAGHVWDDVVAWTVDQGLTGLEALSGIPGCAGATPVQNVGAYGADIAQTLHQIRALDRATGEVVELSNAELEFGYRDSIIKRTLADAATDPRAATPRWVVLSVEFDLRRSGSEAPVRYAQLARALGVEEGEHASLQAVRDHVLQLRAGKGMVLNADDHDTWSTGSFFTNPIVPAALRAQLPDTAPAFGAGEDPESGEALVKLSAAWLIEHAGFPRGFGTDLVEGRASLSTKHTLALTNRGQACTEDLITVARAVRDGVQSAWGIELTPEPVLLGCSL
ncbi:UDP-N-acetylmuramate dehydrogenase [Citricoccus muralis]|uniref:UDP-N-acetylenolpyruvoylglucosamine reductase n=1 Tax=Citricoccus muralis TaxID=169134 RepID=A0ABY8H444_9MICC|nr:UDP-N-acetylmuramate dehydrogenase [Citricoccus muralis]WFP15908.1 UDP-N-acetylmuramate dehydrogenase [Citricoccus muralis]